MLFLVTMFRINHSSYQMRVVTSDFPHIKTDDLTETYSARARVIARATCLAYR